MPVLNANQECAKQFSFQKMFNFERLECILKRDGRTGCIMVRYRCEDPDHNVGSAVFPPPGFGIWAAHAQVSISLFTFHLRSTTEPRILYQGHICSSSTLQINNCPTISVPVAHVKKLQEEIFSPKYRAMLNKTKVFYSEALGLITVSPKIPGISMLVDWDS